MDQASSHDFTYFSEAPPEEVKSYIRDRQNILRGDLQKQIETKEKMKSMVKERDYELELQKKMDERSNLQQAWDCGVRMRNIRKSIESFRSSGKPGPEMSSVVSSTPRKTTTKRSTSG